MGKTLRNILIAASMFTIGACSSGGGSDSGGGNGGGYGPVGSVTGRIIFQFAENNEVVYNGLSNARIYAVNTDAKTYSDLDGYFVLSNAPVGFQEIKGTCLTYDGCEPYEDTSYNLYDAANPISKFITVVEDSSHELGDFQLTPTMYRDKIILGRVYSSEFSSSPHIGSLNLYEPDSFCSGNVPRANCAPTNLLEESFTNDGYFVFRRQTGDPNAVVCLSISITSPQDEIYFYESGDECTTSMLNDWIFQKYAYVNAQ